MLLYILFAHLNRVPVQFFKFYPRDPPRDAHLHMMPTNYILSRKCIILQSTNIAYMYVIVGKS